MDYLRHGVKASLKDKCTATKRVNASVDLLAKRLADGHTLYGKNDDKADFTILE